MWSMSEKMYRRLVSKMNVASNFRLIEPYFDSFISINNNEDKNHSGYRGVDIFERVAIHGALYLLEKTNKIGKVIVDDVVYSYGVSLLMTNTGEAHLEDRRHLNLTKPIILMQCNCEKGQAIIVVSIPMEIDKVKTSYSTIKDSYMLSRYMNVDIVYHSNKTGKEYSYSALMLTEKIDNFIRNNGSKYIR